MGRLRASHYEIMLLYVRYAFLLQRRPSVSFFSSPRMYVHTYVCTFGVFILSSPVPVQYLDSFAQKQHKLYAVKNGYDSFG